MSDGRKRASKRKGLREMEEVNSPPPKATQGSPSRVPNPTRNQTWRTSFIPITEEMIKAEKMLKARVMTGNIIGPRMVSPEDVRQAVCTQFRVPPTLVRVYPSYPSDFLLQFAMLDLAKKVNKRKIVSGPGFEVVVWPWSREEDSDEVPFNTKVEIKIQGIPAHAWRESSVHTLLDEYCAIQTIQMSEFLRGDMAAVHVTTLTSSLDQIPPMAYLAIPEPASGADLYLTTDPMAPTITARRRRYPIKFTTREITNTHRTGNNEGPNQQDDSDSTPTGAYDYESPSPGSLEIGYDHDSDREPAAWK
ncbi:hypothetical protein EJB05_14318 [Eragrostis curvula]|uniref:DUF4283 domain-containing protein n=1 Tax=Eragrostis curvula TaxID=38414 RepID=A0A5J9VY72_9POAL|nr:hypothetical protein EJB05_14318 [Eragrostis curvula]